MKNAMFATIAAALVSAGMTGAQVPVETPLPAKPSAEASGLVVHEWGVWVRTSTDHGTMWSSPTEMVSQLPPFVRLVQNESRPKRQNHGWDKPVIHLYGPDGLAVSVKIATPQGHPTAYFPAAALEAKTITVTDAGVMMVYSLTDCFGLQWNGTLFAQPQGALPQASPGHWWERVRQVPSAYFRGKESEERFLFYEATAFQEPLVVAEFTGDEFTLKLDPPKHQTGETPAGEIGPLRPVLVVINDGANRWLHRVEQIAADLPVKLKKADALRHPAAAPDILAAAQSQWESYGLTKAEAAAIVETWKPDLLGTHGFLVISRLPPTVYERMFPLTVTPTPAETVRAGVVFDTLPGCGERLNWLPELKRLFEKWGHELGSDNPKVREAAAASLAREGDLARPVLEDLLQQGSDAVKAEAGSLLDLLMPQKVDGPLLPARSPDQWFRARRGGV